jgi:hypothetical protein
MTCLDDVAIGDASEEGDKNDLEVYYCLVF